MPRGKHWTIEEKAKVSAMLAINLKYKDIAMHINRSPHAISMYLQKHPEIRDTAKMLELLDAEVKKTKKDTDIKPITVYSNAPETENPRRRKVEKPTVIRKNLFGRLWEAIRG